MSSNGNPMDQSSLTLSNFAANINGSAVITSLVISLLIILYSLRCMYSRCVRRRDMRRSDHVPPQLIIAIGAPQFHSFETGLDPSVIAALPTFIYKKPDQFDGTGVPECSICLSNLEEEEMIRLLPNCSHLFHTQCIDMWLSSQLTCPICRTAVAPPATPVPEQEPEVQTHGTVDHEVSSTSSVPLEPLNSMTPRSEIASDEASQSSKVAASTSRPSSFHKIISWTRSGRGIQPFELSGDGVEDPERQ
ncbi:hypothetical protein NE237_023485 [Protea cynaroides]|uniref:RING-type E3 ubiquitin transferase n=1 Tax=Protea cynaroides TaxID=273540 RepID=A0A9Q0HBK6_9MAGN|nr:hypothetical protein NE237_023485 [Protea cynaroides]